MSNIPDHIQDMAKRAFTRWLNEVNALVPHESPEFKLRAEDCDTEVVYHSDDQVEVFILISVYHRETGEYSRIIVTGWWNGRHADIEEISDVYEGVINYTGGPFPIKELDKRFANRQ